jgi:hypothetical protein
MQENEFQTPLGTVCHLLFNRLPKLLKWKLTRPTLAQTEGFEGPFEQKKTKEAKHWPEEPRNLRAPRSLSLERVCSLRYLLFNPLLRAFTSGCVSGTFGLRVPLTASLKSKTT